MIVTSASAERARPITSPTSSHRPTDKLEGRVLSYTSIRLRGSQTLLDGLHSVKCRVTLILLSWDCDPVCDNI
ncbi:hypothetical protein RRG08_036894 [Elysia crispata]|uniref:Uncharacterized protein n=1 Tax=Elysia crispata TaxID=231223 RepID=A0AAE0ZD83_9GAST|nr:hypothetical protein RRG08_036894 [Elysia crispata]